MAVSTPAPHPDNEPAPDLVTFDEAAELFRPTGHPVTAQTLRRRAVQHGVRIVRQGRANAASWSDLLDVHAAMYPPPGPR